MNARKPTAAAPQFSTADIASQREQPGYYPGFNTLHQQGAWDATTRDVILRRVEAPPAIRYFSTAEVQFWSMVFEHLIPQSDRSPERQIPILQSVDDRLFENRSVGYRFTDMPSDREAYTLGRQALDEEAHAVYEAAFIDLSYPQREAILQLIHDGTPQAANAIWKDMSIHRFWQLIMTDAIDAYYAHPWSWDEIGFGGPAYPRAYTRLEHGDPEPWEVSEQRYDWASPPDARSADVETTDEFHTEAIQHRSHIARSNP